MTALAAYPIPVRRAAIAALVLAIHAMLIALLLRATFSTEPLHTTAHERIYWLMLHPRPKPVPQIQALPRATPSRARAPRKQRIPVLPNVPAAPPTNGETLQGLHLDLFGCSPENLANLSPEERAHCATTLKRPNDNSVDFADHTNRSHDAALWARRLAKKQNPLLLPCMSPQMASPLYTLYCAGTGIINGFDLDSMPGYGDKPTEVHVPNGSDPPNGPARR